MSGGGKAKNMWKVLTFRRKLELQRILRQIGFVFFFFFTEEKYLVGCMILGMINMSQ